MANTYYESYKLDRLNYYKKQMKAIITNQYLDSDETIDHLKKLHTDVEGVDVAEDSDYYNKSEKLLNDIECYIDILI